ncbi:MULTISPECIES: hypothetical protein [Diaphorobacter]|uniref:Uncharacterized protein n=2 Tax=Diaphorobacter TaxID=238749 RepID=A0AAX1WSE1_9BURK|nr:MULTISPECIES: hypothetical protein [Diaphorobacter]MDU7587937.1 hypothetical protein [Acidovorax sp.]TFI46891.1 hypothetical protein E4O93_15515 [Diaphorobacter sp. DS2]UOB04151.1 hypothetical protein MRB47_11915 [Diaphorobacter sp. LI3]ACM33050.1 conserved hypothetical protein [[Acidovorax] ebreus TPSY]ASI68198.1 hypothetical protein BA022_06155 [Diaphorobacter nitroreducens]
MRTGFGLIGLLLALALVAVLVKKQMGATRVAVPPAVQGLPAPAEGAASTVRAQSQQVQQQVKQQMDALMQQPRTLPED